MFPINLRIVRLVQPQKPTFTEYLIHMLSIQKVSNIAGSDNVMKTNSVQKHIYDTSYRSHNFNDRIRFAVLHYTAVNFSDSIKIFTEGNVSAHYLIPDIKDETYIATGRKEMKIFNLVDEDKRAWHAGVSCWNGRNNINDTSIGIEIVNMASCENGEFHFPEFTKIQIETVIQLLKEIKARNKDIEVTNVIGHSDIAIGRKLDPGPQFPWKMLYEAGIGAWYDEKTKNEFVEIFSFKLPIKKEIIKMLDLYGYDTRGTEKEEQFKNVIRAFQLHFRPSNYNGEADIETLSILWALVKKYRKDE